MHAGKQVLGGPVWFVATFFILGALALAVFVFIDSMRPKRAESVAGRLPEPLWVYTVLEGLFIGSLIVVQVAKGVSLMSAVPVAIAPFAIAAGVAYLLRVVYPKPE
jgi:FtsH-binding integral membrane protein